MSSDEEDDEFDDEMGQPFGEDNYELKKAAIQYEKYNTVNTLRLKEGYADMKNSIAEEFGNSVEILKETLTPSFMKRMKYKKQFPAKVAASEMYVTFLTLCNLKSFFRC